MKLSSLSLLSLLSVSVLPVTLAQASEWTRGPVDSGLAEPVTFLRCRPAQPIYDAGENVILQHERVGASAVAILERISIMGATRTAFHDLRSRPLIVEGDMAIGTIYEAREDGHELDLVVNVSQADGNGVAPARLTVDGATAEMSCQSFMTVN